MKESLEEIAEKVIYALMKKDDRTCEVFLHSLDWKFMPKEEGKHSTLLRNKKKPVEVCTEAANALGLEVKLDIINPMKKTAGETEFYCEIHKGDGVDGSVTVGWANGETKDEAICLAAVMAVGVEI